MNARRAARELALITMSQLGAKKCQAADIDDIVLLSVRTLANEASGDLKITTSALIEIREFVENYEAEHSSNVERPLEVSNIPVPMPMTSDMIGRIDSLVNVAEKAFQALEVAELTALANKHEVKDYVYKIIQNYNENKAEIDGQINAFSKKWNIERLLKIDRDILKIAVAELLFHDDIPMKVSVDEAVELSKKYSSEESSSFINGILGQIIKTNNITKSSKV